MQAQPKPRRLLRFHSVFPSTPFFFLKAEEKYVTPPSRNRPFISYPCVKSGKGRGAGRGSSSCEARGGKELRQYMDVKNTTESGALLEKKITSERLELNLKLGFPQRRAHGC